MNGSDSKQRQIEQRRIELVAQYPALWRHMLAEWMEDGEGSRLWLMYAANYLVRSHNVRWAIDPYRLSRRIPVEEALPVENLRQLSFVLLTHRHNDHLDQKLIWELRNFPIQWIVPPFLLDEALQLEINPARVIVPKALEPMEIEGVRITPFHGLHQHQTPDGVNRGVPAMGYLVEMNGSRWLFPGDTRRFERERLPHFGPVNLAAAHLWLGKGRALNPDPQRLEGFCRFFSALQPETILITHLQEVGRDATEYWDCEHFQAAAARLAEIAPEIAVRPLMMGESATI